VAEQGKLCYLLHCVASAPLLNSMRELGMAVDHRNEGENHAVLKETETQIGAWFQGKLQIFDLPTQLQGTLFQKRVWQQIRRVSYSQTSSYRRLAAGAGHPQAVRAVGTACGSNPLPLIIPCHRIVRSDGSIGRFAWGAEIKQKLLDIEQSYKPGSSENWTVDSTRLSAKT